MICCSLKAGFSLHFPKAIHKIWPVNILSKGNGVMFLETTDRMNPPSFVLCAIESAARVYPDRPIVFFMKGLKEINSEDDQKKAKGHFPTLSSFNNIFFFPLRMEEIFRDTPLLPWYEKVNPEREEHWTHVSSDGCRLALNWKYGGIYMDTDIISIRRITGGNFLAVESSMYVSNGVFGLLPQHNFTWWSMENFVEKYNGAIWAHNGPHLFTRVLKQMCAIQELITVEDFMCKDITLLNPQRFYPIPYESWELYYEVWEDLPTFNDSYALHLWNYMNVDHMTVIPGSNMLMEHLYQQFCPSTYGALQRNESTVL
uniref:Alpha 1,4-glycosyltransferase domain-containing protein n=1 Tax=Leptobrachium leishanense TaxID=445787 RepID=A0A8C5MP34_9ANUR